MDASTEAKCSKSDQVSLHQVQPDRNGNKKPPTPQPSPSTSKSSNKMEEGFQSHGTEQLE